MIKINLKEDYIDEKVKEIFLKLTESIIKKLQNCVLALYDDTDAKIQINVDSIYKFLISKDFYKYNYIIYSHIEGITNDMVKNWLELPSGYAISSFLKPQAKSKKQYRDFYEKYSSCNKEFFDNLKIFFSKDKNLKASQKREFLKKYYPVYNLIVDAFSYDVLNEEDRAILLAEMNVNVCPYCNMNYTLNYKRNTKIKATADLDHFYVKSHYPLYALCLYNFIPSCPICNSRLKLDNAMTIETHIYPHNNSYADKEVFVISNLIEYLADKCDCLEIKLDTLVKEDKINNSNQLFQIEQRYQFFESKAKELLDNAITYNEIYQKELYELLSEFSSIDIRNAIFGKKLTEEEILNESLGKFRMDILENLGVF